jgi:hypothetical protein
MQETNCGQRNRINSGIRGKGGARVPPTTLAQSADPGPVRGDRSGGGGAHASGPALAAPPPLASPRLRPTGRSPAPPLSHARTHIHTHTHSLSRTSSSCTCTGGVARIAQASPHGAQCAAARPPSNPSPQAGYRRGCQGPGAGDESGSGRSPHTTPPPAPGLRVPSSADSSLQRRGRPAGAGAAAATPAAATARPAKVPAPGLRRPRRAAGMRSGPDSQPAGGGDGPRRRAGRSGLAVESAPSLPCKSRRRRSSRRSHPDQCAGHGGQQWRRVDSRSL